MTDLTRAQIEEWLRLAEAATPGTWREWTLAGKYPRMAVSCVGLRIVNVMNQREMKANAELIAFSRTAVPALCRALLAAWRYEAEAMAARPVIENWLNESPDDHRRRAAVRAYAAARAALGDLDAPREAAGEKGEE